MTAPALGALLGVSAGAGILLVLGWWGRSRRIAILERIGPWVGSADPAVDRRGPSMHAALTLLGRRMSRPTAAWAVGGAVVGAALGIVAGTIAAALLLGVVGALAGALVAGATDAHRRALRARRIDAALPDAVMLVALAVGAGEPTVAALARVVREIPGDLGDELGGIVAAVHAGTTVEAGMRRAAEAAPTEALRRFESTLALAVERGTPLAAVLRDQADDARAAHGRTLMESAGRRDVAMLVPVVFVILPVVIVIALYPAVSSLRLITP